MLREADLFTTSIGTGYSEENISTNLDACTFSTSSSINPAYSRREEVKGVKTTSGVQSDVYPDPLLNEITIEVTGGELLDFSHFLVKFRFQMATVTGYRITYLPTKIPVIETPHVVLAETPSVETSAERLRAISGLEIEQLAKIFLVSRTTYHKWVKNDSIPNSKHREHLLEVLSHVEKAAQRLGSQRAAANWLLTPILATGKKPIEYLATRKYSVFRGFLLSVQTGQEVLRASTLSKREYRELSKEEVEDSLERLRPRAWVEEDKE